MRLGEIVARNLRRIRQERGLTQEDLALRVGINRNYVGMVEREENSPTIAMIERIAKVLRIDPVDLLRRERAQRGSAPLNTTLGRRSRVEKVTD